jgi:hypothetical protein
MVMRASETSTVRRDSSVKDFGLAERQKDFGLSGKNLGLAERQKDFGLSGKNLGLAERQKDFGLAGHGMSGITGKKTWTHRARTSAARKDSRTAGSLYVA